MSAVLPSEYVAVATSCSVSPIDSKPLPFIVTAIDMMLDVSVGLAMDAPVGFGVCVASGMYPPPPPPPPPIAEDDGVGVASSV